MKLNSLPLLYLLVLYARSIVSSDTSVGRLGDSAKFERVIHTEGVTSSEAKASAAMTANRSLQTVVRVIRKIVLCYFSVSIIRD